MVNITPKSMLDSIKIPTNVQQKTDEDIIDSIKKKKNEVESVIESQ